jgi:hypothetical protein
MVRPGVRLHIHLTPFPIILVQDDVAWRLRYVRRPVDQWIGVVIRWCLVGKSLGAVPSEPSSCFRGAQSWSWDSRERWLISHTD